jgi:hypothetical protein
MVHHQEEERLAESVEQGVQPDPEAGFQPRVQRN